MKKTADNRLAYYLVKFEEFRRLRMSPRKVRRALRLMRYKSILLRRLESDKPREVAV